MIRLLNSLLGSAALVTLSTATALAVPVSVFSDDFESGSLSQWTGKGGGSHSGVIVVDPLDPTNHVLSFTQLISAGDVFSIDTISTQTSFTISFDYLGTPVALSSGGNGGYLGLSTGFPDTHTWIAETGNFYPNAIKLIDDNKWHHYDLTFSYLAPNTEVHLMLEDFIGSGGVAGDAYFDNIGFRDTAQPDPFGVPDGGTTLVMFGLGLIGLLGGRRFLQARIAAS